MVTITAQLVLASLNSSITASSTKTPYLKLIDLWFVAILTIVFSVNLCQVIINVVLNWKKLKSFFHRFVSVQPLEEPVSEMTKVLGWVMPQGPKKSPDHFRMAKIVNSICCIVTLIIIILFVAVYAIISVG